MLRDIYGFNSSPNVGDYSGEWSFAPQGVAIAAAGGPFGDSYLAVNSDDHMAAAYQVPGNPVLTGKVVFGLRFWTLGTGPVRFFFLDAAGQVQVEAQVSTSGAVSLYRYNSQFSLPVGASGAHGGGGGTNFSQLLWQSQNAPVPVDGTQAYLEFGLTAAANGGGTFELRVNGQAAASVTGLDTLSSGNASFGGYMVGGACCLTHGYVSDTTGTSNTGFLGDVRVVEMPPTGPGGHADFAPTGQADNWQNAAQVPPNPADYNAASTVGATDTFAHAPLPAATASVLGVKVRNRALKVGSGSRALAGALVSGTAAAALPGHALAATCSSYSDVVEADPATGAAWTPAAVNAAQAGYSIAN